MNWKVGADELVFDLRELSKLALELEPTKRNVVSLIGKFFDPIGSSCSELQDLHAGPM